MDYTQKRQEMVRIIEEEDVYTSTYTGKGSIDKQILKVMAEIPRHEFVPKLMRFFAYDNGPVHIGNGQTISQPYIVALMTDLISPQPDHKILDIGTGSGYQAAILSRLVRQVYSVEIVESLAIEAIARLQGLKYENIEIKVGDGALGWEEHCPYDGIIVAAATPTIPSNLIEQLKPGGKLVLPLGISTKVQELVVIEKKENGEGELRHILPVVFVPLISKYEDIVD